jgi:hypothetical protein
MRRPRTALGAALLLLAAAVAGEPAKPPEAEKPKTGYEAFLEKGKLLDFPERKWEQAFPYRSQCYDVRTNTSADVAEYAGVLMDAVHYHYRLRFGIESTPRGRICIFRTKEDMFEYAKKQCKWTPPDASVGFFTTAGGGTICAVWKELSGQKPENVLMHEGTHQFAHAVFRGALPVWLSEGFAVYFENSSFDGRNLDVGRVPAGRLKQLQDKMRGDKHVTLEKLFATEQKDFGVDCYGAAWALVFWLAHAGDARELKLHEAALGQFVADCRRNQKDGKVLAGYLGRPNLAALEKEWKEWVLKLDPKDPYGGTRAAAEKPPAPAGAAK